MSRLVFNRDGGKTDEFGHLLGLARSMQGEVIEGLLVAANGSPNMTVNVPIGTAMIPVSSGGTAYKYFVGVDATESVAITTANPSNPRNDLIVMYVDIAVTASQSYTNNSNNMLKIVAVAGTPAASPADPSEANIQAAIGAANPYIILARVVVGAGVTQINSGNVTDLRNLAQPLRVGNSALLDNSVTNNKVANSAITASKIDFTTTTLDVFYDSSAATTSLSTELVLYNKSITPTTNKLEVDLKCSTGSQDTSASVGVRFYINNTLRETENTPKGANTGYTETIMRKYIITGLTPGIAVSIKIGINNAAGTNELRRGPVNPVQVIVKAA